MLLWLYRHLQRSSLYSTRSTTALIKGEAEQCKHGLFRRRRQRDEITLCIWTGRQRMRCLMKQRPDSSNRTPSPHSIPSLDTKLPPLLCLVLHVTWSAVSKLSKVSYSSLHSHPIQSYNTGGILREPPTKKWITCRGTQKMNLQSNCRDDVS